MAINKRILITGVAGLIGSRMANWIVENFPDCVVLGIDDLSGGFTTNVDKRVKFEVFNLLETDRLNTVFSEFKPDVVYHFAAYAAEGLSPFIRSYNYQNNLVATANVINQCINNEVDRLVFTSSMAVYGYGSGEMFHEDDVPSPIDPYGIAKFACEMDIMVAGEQHGLKWSIIRPHNVYGVNQNIWDKYRNVLGIWMYQCLKGEKMTIFGDGEQTRAFSYIDDCLEPIWKCAFSEKSVNEIINLGGIQKYTINQANAIIQEITGSIEVEYLEARHEVKNTHPSHEKSVRLLDFKHVTPLEVGLKKMWDWAIVQPDRARKGWGKYEVDKKIYSYWK